MIKSMTGFGRCQKMLAGKDITVEIKAVNHRYFEFTARASRGYAFLEERLKSFVQSQVSRGKIDVYVSLLSVDDESVLVDINRPLAGSYINALKELSREYGIPDDITVSTVARYNDIFSVRRAQEDEEAVWEAVKTVAQEAINGFIAMRESEGEKLCKDICQRADYIISCVDTIEMESPKTLSAYRERLRAKIEEVLADRNIDEQRLLTECAIYADKIAVDEETVRLRSHIGQLRSAITSNEPSGRKLDFIVQEINRETNTIGSKSQNTDIAYTVVQMKAEIEKIREQVQNIE